MTPYGRKGTTDHERVLVSKVMIGTLTQEHGRKHILVVDDNPTIRENFQVVLARKGYTVIAVPNSYEAIEQVKAQTFDIIFLNVILPKINGLETFERIKALDSEARIVLMTGHPEHELVREIIYFGPVVILRKPLRTDEIYHTVDMLTSRPRLLGSRRAWPLRPTSEGRGMTAILVTEDEELLQEISKLAGGVEPPA